MSSKYKHIGLKTQGLTMVDSWNKDGPQRFIFFNIWSQVGRALWQNLRGATLLERMCVTGARHWIFKRFFSSPLLHPLCGSRCELLVTTPARCIPAWCHAFCCDGQRLSYSETQINSFIFKLPWSCDEVRVKASQQLHFEIEWR